MAYSQHVDGNHRHRPQRRTRPPSLSDPLAWEQIQHPTLDSLPYRTRPRAADVDIQMPDSASRRTKYSASSSHRGRRASEDLHESMSPPTNPRRSRTVTYRKDSFASADEDDELSTGPQRRARSRMRRTAMSRSRSSGSGSSSSSSSRSEIVLAPSRSARVDRSAAVSRPSPRSTSSRRSSSTDSTSTLSTQNEVQEILRYRNDEIEVLPDPETSVHRRHRRQHREREPVVYEEEPLQISRHVVVSESREAPRRRHKHRSDSRSRSRRRHHHHHQDHLVKPSSSKRGHKKYYASDSGYTGKPKLPRSSSSHVASVHSVSTSSRRSSSAMNKFFYGPSPKSQKLVECVACLDEEIPSSRAAKLKCKHYMCYACLKRVFKVSIKNPQSMPPKCCTEDPIPVKHVEQLFETSFKKTWNRKFAEYSTRNRLYCPSSKCGEWIKPNRIQKLRDGRKTAKCSHCKTDVCVACRGKWHRSKDCPGDVATNELLEQAKELGWQQCFDCGQLVELDEGCNHMTCRCGAQFCMICGIKWKNCECPWFKYDALELDQLDDVNVAASIRSERDKRPPRDRESRAGKSSRHRPSSTYDEEVSLRRVQERHDEDFARQLQYEDDDNDDEEDDFVFDTVAVGNAAGHFMNDDYRRAPRVIPAAPSPPMQAVDRPGAGDYVSGVNKARGVRAHSLERRLADRFSESRQGTGTSPTHRPYNMSMPPPVPPVMGIPVMSQPPPPPPPGMGHLRRAHTMGEEMYGTPSRSRLSERYGPEHAMADYDADTGMYASSSRRRQRGRDREQPPGAPPGSVLAGLTGPGSGMNRVDEWRSYVMMHDETESGIAVN